MTRRRFAAVRVFQLLASCRFFSPSSAAPSSRRVQRLASAALCSLLTVSVAQNAQAQTTSARAETPVRAEFRTAPRSLVTAHVDRNRVVTTVGAVSPKAAVSTDLGSADAAMLIRNMQLVLNRPAERQAAFDAQLEALHTPGNPSFHKWLQPAQVGAEFGPSDADIAALTGFLQAEGFTVTTVGSGRTYIDFQGTAAQVENTFRTPVHNYKLKDGSVHYSAVKDAQIPEALAALVVGFAGLSDIPAAKTMIAKRTSMPAPNTPRDGVYVQTEEGISPAPMDTVSSTNYAVGPQDFYTIYNENALLSATTPINGSGVTVAMLEQVRIVPSDVTTFRTNFGVVPNTPVSLVTQYGYTGGVATAQTCTDPGAITSSSYNDEGEAILDTEWASAVAPKANILYVACLAGALPLGTVIAGEVVVDNNLADIMSMSYGLYEGYNAAEDTLVNNLWEQAASQGQTVVVSSGDAGSATEDGNYGDTYAKYGITVSGIASTAWNVSAGGTDFMDEYNTLVGDTAYGLPNYWNTATSTSANGFSSAKSYIPEMTWNDNCSSPVYARYYYGASQADARTFCGANKATLNTTGGGGGPSKLHARPTWQTGTVYGLPTTTSQPNRLQPDVSLFASNGFWYHTLPSYESDNGGYSYAGGTSFVAPQLAGVFALIKQSTGERLGQPNYVLYAMAGKEFGTTTATGNCSSSGSTYDAPSAATPAANCIFYDVQVGSNSAPCKSTGANCSLIAGKTYGIVYDATKGASPAVAAYITGTGYDMGTGIGTINIANLINNWQDATNGQNYTPTITLTPATTTVNYKATATTTFTATVAGNGSFPTGTVTFSGNNGLGTLATAALVPSSGCTTGGTCTESITTAVIPGNYTPGTYTITAAYTATNENYVTASTTATVTVNKIAPALTFTVASPQHTLIPSIALAASTNSTGAVTYAVLSGPATLNGNTLTLTGTGTVQVQATVAADPDYLQASATSTFTVLAGSIWASNSAGTLSVFDLLGNAVTPFTGGGLGTIAGPLAQAFDNSGNLWVASSSGVSEFGATGAAYGTGPYTTGGITTPYALALDGAGAVWIANANGSISNLANNGTALSSSTGYVAAGLGTPGGIAVDSSGSVWVTNTTDNSVTEIVGSATPVAPLATSLANNTVGVQP